MSALGMCKVPGCKAFQEDSNLKPFLIFPFMLPMGKWITNYKQERMTTPLY